MPSIGYSIEYSANLPYRLFTRAKSNILQNARTIYSIRDGRRMINEEGNSKYIMQNIGYFADTRYITLTNIDNYFIHLLHQSCPGSSWFSHDFSKFAIMS